MSKFSLSDMINYYAKRDEKLKQQELASQERQKKYKEIKENDNVSRNR